jgi:hypothetical protein
LDNDLFLAMRCLKQYTSVTEVEEQNCMPDFDATSSFELQESEFSIGIQHPEWTTSLDEESIWFVGHGPRNANIDYSEGRCEEDVYFTNGLGVSGWIRNGEFVRDEEEVGGS